jgi:hypothetical protein
MQMENPKLIQLIVTLTGLVGGAYFLAIANPPMDFYYLLPIFAMLGLIVASVGFAIVRQVIKELSA